MTVDLPERIKARIGEKRGVQVYDSNPIGTFLKRNYIMLPPKDVFNDEYVIPQMGLGFLFSMAGLNCIRKGRDFQTKYPEHIRPRTGGAYRILGVRKSTIT